MTATGPAAARAEILEAEVIRSLTPTPEFVERLAKVRAELLHRTEEAARASRSRLSRCLVAGSAARGGFLQDRVDVDFFLLFPTHLTRVELETEGLALARAVLPVHELRYAEHPYLRGTLDGFQVDVVPGYAVADGAHPQSAVDRTPFHQQYLEARETPEVLDQVRLAKQFLRTLGVYGSEARTSGFSGYLVELLIVRFGTLRGLLEAARAWRPPVRLVTTPGASPRVPDEIALVLDDPVDPARNVSSALSRRNFGIFVLAAGAYLDHPTPSAFEPRARPKLGRAAGLHEVAQRATHVTIVELPRPSLVDDVLYPQLRKAERGLLEAAERWGFQPIGSGAGADATHLVIALEFNHGLLPAVRVRDGPPVGLDRVGSFLERWAGPEVLQGPYVRADGTLAVDTRREERRIEALLRDGLPQISLGQDLRKSVPDAQILELSGATDGDALSEALVELFRKSLPFARPTPPSG